MVLNIVNPFDWNFITQKSDSSYNIFVDKPIKKL